MIAIPDFAAGAMENWGLITYRETALLFKPGESSESNKKRVASVVSHELAHQVSVYTITTLAVLERGSTNYTNLLAGLDYGAKKTQCC